MRGIIVACGHGFHHAKPGEHHRRDDRFCAAGKHNVRVAAPNHFRRRTDRVRARRASGDDCRVVAARAIIRGDVKRRHVRQNDRRREGAKPVGTFFQKEIVRDDGFGHTAERGAEQHAGAIIFAERIAEPGIADRLLGGAEREQTGAPHSPRVFGIHILGRVVPFDFGGDARFIIRRVEQGDRAQTGFADQQVLPKLFGCESERRDRAQAGDDDARAFGARLPLQLGKFERAKPALRRGFEFGQGECVRNHFVLPKLLVWYLKLC